MRNNQPEIIQNTVAGIKQIKTLLYWQHKARAEAHCLVRLYIWLTQPKAVAIISEIESNPLGFEITDDLIGVVEAITQAFWIDIEPKLENFVWIVHHGRFSYHEALNRETFTRVDLKWKGRSIECDLSDWKLLTDAEIQAVLDRVELEPVQTILKKLDQLGLKHNSPDR